MMIALIMPEDSAEMLKQILDKLEEPGDWREKSKKLYAVGLKDAMSKMHDCWIDTRERNVYTVKGKEFFPVGIAINFLKKCKR